MKSQGLPQFYAKSANFWPRDFEHCRKVFWALEANRSCSASLICYTQPCGLGATFLISPDFSFLVYKMYTLTVPVSLGCEDLMSQFKQSTFIDLFHKYFMWNYCFTAAVLGLQLQTSEVKHILSSLWKLVFCLGWQTGKERKTCKLNFWEGRRIEGKWKKVYEIGNICRKPIVILNVTEQSC